MIRLDERPNARSPERPFVQAPLSTQLQLLAVRDADLLERINGASGFLRETVTRQCEQIQAKRDSIAAMPAGQRRRVETGDLLREEKGPNRDDLRYIHSVLAVCGLPYVRQEKREWERRQGQMSLYLTAGQLMDADGNWVKQPLPYGSRARLMLLHTCSEAKRNGSPVVPMENSLSGFMKSLGLQVTGGKNGSLNSFKQQVNALAACNMSIGHFDGKGASGTISTKPFSKIEQVFFKNDGSQQMLWPETLELSPEFYATLSKHALPVNMHAVRAFSSSARKLDILFWLGFRIRGEGNSSISWKAPHEQFGDGYSRLDNFKRDFVREMNEIKEVFEKLPVTFSEKGITVSHGVSEILAIPTKGRKT